MKELVSIIMPLYNAEKYIGKTIESVLNQTYDNWELLITNDGSIDRSSKIVEKYVIQDKRIKLFNQLNAGSAKARNNSLKYAKGRYITFLDADDIWENIFLEDQINYMQENNYSLVFSSYKRIDENGKEILSPYIVPSKVSYVDLLKTCSLSCLTSIYDSEKIGKVYFNENLKSLRDDFVMWLSILKKEEYAYGNPKVLASYRIFKFSTTANKKKMIKPQFKVYYEVEKLGLLKSLYYLFYWGYNGIKKYYKRGK